MPVRQLDDLIDHALEEIAVVRHHDDAAVKAPQLLLEPFGCVAVQMVGRLVQYQHVRGMDERAHQRDALALSARHRADILLNIRHAESVQHGARLIFGLRAEIGAVALEYRIQRRVVVAQIAVLRQIGNFDVRVGRHSARIRRDASGEDFQKRALARAVEPDQADLSALLEIERHVVQQLFVAIVFGNVFRGKKHFISSKLNKRLCPRPDGRSGARSLP